MGNAWDGRKGEGDLCCPPHGARIMDEQEATSAAFPFGLIKGREGKGGGDNDRVLLGLKKIVGEMGKGGGGGVGGMSGGFGKQDINR